MWICTKTVPLRHIWSLLSCKAVLTLLSLIPLNFYAHSNTKQSVCENTTAHLRTNQHQRWRWDKVPHTNTEAASKSAQRTYKGSQDARFRQIPGQFIAFKCLARAPHARQSDAPHFQSGCPTRLTVALSTKLICGSVASYLRRINSKRCSSPLQTT
jgi:hypothetical protein